MDPEINKIIIETLLPFKPKQICVFGNYARGEMNDDSDMDILVDFPKGVTYLDIGGIYMDLMEKLMTKFSEELTFEEFKENEMAYDACVLNFINVAESFKILPPAFRLAYPKIPYHKIMGLRNIAVHTYEGLDPKILYETIQHDIPSFWKR